MEGLDHEGNFQKIIAKVPLDEMYDYKSNLRSMTQGRARFRLQFSDYTPVLLKYKKS